MLAKYVPNAGDIVWLDFDRQAGRDEAQAPSRAGPDRLFLQPHQRACGCLYSHQSARALPLRASVEVDQVEGAVLVDQLESLDWGARRAEFHLRADPSQAAQVRIYLGVLLGIS